MRKNFTLPQEVHDTKHTLPQEVYDIKQRELLVANLGKCIETLIYETEAYGIEITEITFKTDYPIYPRDEGLLKVRANVFFNNQSRMFVWGKIIPRKINAKI